jgi:hypothetical protein
VKAYELIKETVCRRSFIPITHIVWCALYTCFFCVEPSTWGEGLFIFGGVMLPLILTAGIYGDDYSSGRICVVLTRPVGIVSLYLYRLLGVTLQGLANMAMAVCIILIVRRFTGHGSGDKFWIWLLSSGLMFMAWAAFSASLSVCMKQSYNFIFIAIGMIAVMFLMSLMHYSDELPRKVLMAFIRYALPPIELLTRLAKDNLTALQTLGYISHALGLTAVYSLAGIVLLSKRELSRE